VKNLEDKPVESSSSYEILVDSLENMLYELTEIEATEAKILDNIRRLDIDTLKIIKKE
jgi:hypothetical protein